MAGTEFIVRGESIHSARGGLSKDRLPALRGSGIITYEGMCALVRVPRGGRHGSGGIVCLQVVSLKPQDVSDQHFPLLCGHPDKASVEAISPSGIGDGIEPQHFG